MNAAKFFTILRARRVLVLSVFAVTVFTTAIVSFLIPKSYTASASLVVDYKNNDPLLGTTGLPAQLSPSYMATQVDILQSHRVAVKVVEDLKIDKNQEALIEFQDEAGGRGSARDWLAEKLLDKLKVIPSRDSRILTLEYSANDPRLARIIANAFAKAYIDTTLELSIDPARRSAVWLDDQLKSLRGTVEQTQTKLTEAQRRSGIIATDERIDTETAKLNALSQELVTAQSQSADANSRVAQAQRLLKSGIEEYESSPDVMSNAFVQSLRAEISRQQAKLDELSHKVGANHPQFQSAKMEIDSLKRKLVAEVDNVAQGINNSARLVREREASLARAVQEQKQKILHIKQQREELDVLQNELDTTRRVYDAALQRSNQINLESQFNQTNVNLLTEAVEPVTHSRPKILLNLILSIFLGSMLGIAAAYLAEMLDRRIRDEHDLTDELGLPLLGVLPNSTNSAPRSKRRKWAMPLRSRAA